MPSLSGDAEETAHFDTLVPDGGDSEIKCRLGGETHVDACMICGWID